LEQPYQEWIMMDPWLGERKEAGTIVFQQSRWQILETLPDGWRVSHERLPGRVWRLTKKQIMTNTVNGPREFPGWHLEEERA
jgi:hypothetical protein